ncbi:MAG: DUF2510 domain-containing protein, partial [Actinomycetota bacterium]
MSNGDWHPDPYGRHQLRWWDGTEWTSMVSDNGLTRDETELEHHEPLPPPHLAAQAPVASASPSALTPPAPP